MNRATNSSSANVDGRNIGSFGRFKGYIYWWWDNVNVKSRVSRIFRIGGKQLYPVSEDCRGFTSSSRISPPSRVRKTSYCELDESRLAEILSSETMDVWGSLVSGIGEAISRDGSGHWISKRLAASQVIPNMEHVG